MSLNPLRPVQSISPILLGSPLCVPSLHLYKLSTSSMSSTPSLMRSSRALMCTRWRLLVMHTWWCQDCQRRPPPMLATLPPLVLSSWVLSRTSVSPTDPMTLCSSGLECTLALWWLEWWVLLCPGLYCQEMFANIILQ